MATRHWPALWPKHYTPPKPGAKRIVAISRPKRKPPT